MTLYLYRSADLSLSVALNNIKIMMESWKISYIKYILYMMMTINHLVCSSIKSITLDSWNRKTNIKARPIYYVAPPYSYPYLWWLTFSGAYEAVCVDLCLCSVQTVYNRGSPKYTGIYGCDSSAVNCRLRLANIKTPLLYVLLFSHPDGPPVVSHVIPTFSVMLLMVAFS